MYMLNSNKYMHDVGKMNAQNWKVDFYQFTAKYSPVSLPLHVVYPKDGLPQLLDAQVSAE